MMKFLLKVGKLEISCYVPLFCRMKLFPEVDNLNICINLLKTKHRLLI